MAKQFEIENLLITRADEPDITDIFNLQRAAYQSEAEIYNDYSIQPLTQTLEQAETEFKTSVVLKAVIDGKIIGSVRATVQSDSSIYIGKLMTLPDYQNKGIGKELLQAIEQEFPGKRYWLMTGHKSEKNLRLYKKCGYVIFKTEAVTPELDFVYMEKLPVVTREIEKAEYSLLEDFLYNAIYIPPGEEWPSREVIYQPEIYIYIDDFGNKQGDIGVVAETDGKIVGAAWTRIIPAYGHIDDNTPELAISVLSEYRNYGIGTKLMNKLFELLRENGYQQTSLSVQKDNPAVRFYQRLGYKMYGERLDHAGHEDYLMTKNLLSNVVAI